jgi:HSP20 family protein
MSTTFDDMLENFFSDELMREPVDKVPAINVKEGKENYHIEVAAPGMTKQDFDVSVEQNVLTISGQKKKEDKEEQDKYTRKEFSYQSFERSFNLPESVKAEDISAKYEDGVLNITIPKKEKAKKESKRKINIQ